MITTKQLAKQIVFEHCYDITHGSKWETRCSIAGVFRRLIRNYIHGTPARKTLGKEIRIAITKIKTDFPKWQWRTPKTQPTNT